MSGIVGQVMFHPDGAARRAALRDGVAAMLARMRHRGPDGFGLHDCGQAVLGQALLDPAGETVTGPWQGAEGGAVLVCDAR
ncbi:MAG: asparagine synthetase B, partial [Rhodobacterales bacterium]|nr:asparagine synthetase B [Rhodobacterales bacterium]